VSNALVAGEGHAGEAVGRAAGVGACGSGAAGGRAASSVRTSRRLNPAGISSHPNQLHYGGFIEGPFLRRGALRIPEPCLSDNHVSSGKVGVSANHRSPQHRAGRVCWIGKPGGAVAKRS
jgi:hypothetical protein